MIPQLRLRGLAAALFVLFAMTSRGANTEVNPPPRPLSEMDYAAERGIEHHGLAALEPTAGCGAFVPAAATALVDRTPTYSYEYQDGIVTVEFTVGTDGLAHDTEVVMSVPKARHLREVVESFLRSRFKPAALDGVAVPSRDRGKFTLVAGEGGPMWSLSRFAEMRRAAEQGAPDAQFTIGVAATLDRSLKIGPEAARAMIQTAAEHDEPRAQYWIARDLVPGPGCTDYLRSDAWLGQAAGHQVGGAAVRLAERLLAMDPGPDELRRIHGLLATAMSAEEPYALRHAIALAVDPRVSQVDPAALRAASDRLIKFSTGVDPQDFEAVAAAGAAMGDFGQAIKYQRKALSRAHDLYWNTDLMEGRLALYRDNRPFSGDLLTLPPRATEPPPLRGDMSVYCSGPKCGRHGGSDTRVATGSHIQK
jgi:hypothetical protein